MNISQLYPFLLIMASSLLFGVKTTTAMLSTTTRCALLSMPLLASTATRSVSMVSSAAAFVVDSTPRRIQALRPHPQQKPQQQQHRTIRHGPFVSSSSTLLSASSGESSNNSSNNNNEVSPTWEYVPYDPKKTNSNKPKRKTNNNSYKRTAAASTWTVPKHVAIPEDKLEFSFVRSSGSGGQNVNKLSTKVELRLDVVHERHPWMPKEVQTRFVEQHKNRISKEGILTITSQEHRTQGRNRVEAVTKLRAMIMEAWPRPKIRKLRKGISRAAKVRNKEFKKKRSETKQNRKSVDW